jgi:hypothetical protein
MKAEELAKLLESVPAKSLEKFIEIKKELDQVEAERAGLLSQIDRILGDIEEPAAPPKKGRGRPRKTEAAKAKPAVKETKVKAKAKAKAKAKPKAKAAAKPKAKAVAKKAAAKPAAAKATAKAKRGPGRPRKAAPAAAPAEGKEKKPRGRKPGRGPRPGSAVAYAVEVLKNASKPMTINEIVDAIGAMGFVSQAKNPATSIAQQLYKSPYINVESGKFSLPTA